MRRATGRGAKPEGVALRGPRQAASDRRARAIGLLDPPVAVVMRRTANGMGRHLVRIYDRRPHHGARLD